MEEMKILDKKISMKVLMIILIIVGTGGIASTGLMYINYQNLDAAYVVLTEDYESGLLDYEKLLDDYDELMGVYENQLVVHHVLNESYTILLEEQVMLLEMYEVLLADYYILTGEYNGLNNTYYDLLDQYAILQCEYDALQLEYDLLNNAYILLQDEYNILQAEYDVLLADYNTLQDEYDVLLTDYTTLDLQYNALFDDYVALNDSHVLLQTQYDILYVAYTGIVADYSTLWGDYVGLNDTYNVLVEEHNILLVAYNVLESAYDAITTWIRQMVLPAQFSIFAEAVRRYYFQDYYVKDTIEYDEFGSPIGFLNESGYWAEFARFMRDTVLHASVSSHADTNLYGSEDLWFSDVSDFFMPIIDTTWWGTSSSELAAKIMWSTFHNWIPHWCGWSTPGDNLTRIASNVQWCVDNIDYEYDSIYERFRMVDYDWDYIKFPVETAFRTKGDCEDQAILCAAYLEACGFETAVLVTHDENNAQYGSFYHGALFVKLDNMTAYLERYPGAFVWNMAWWDSSWGQGGVLIDTTWDTPFGTQPAWLQYYLDTYSLWSELTPIWTIAFCDIDGFITYVPPEVGAGANVEISIP